MLTHKGTQEIMTQRLRLRKYVLSDAEAMFKNYATDERVTRFLNWEPYKSIGGVRAFLSETIESYRSDDFYHWAIEFEGEIIGGISAYNIDGENHLCEVGYCIARDCWNKGITSEALKAVMRFLFGEVNMRRITSRHDVKNPASGRVMQKCGMILEGKLREHYLRSDGSTSDCLLYALLKKEFIRGK